MHTRKIVASSCSRLRFLVSTNTQSIFFCVFFLSPAIQLPFETCQRFFFSMSHPSHMPLVTKNHNHSRSAFFCSYPTVVARQYYHCDFLIHDSLFFSTFFSLSFFPSLFPPSPLFEVSLRRCKKRYPRRSVLVRGTPLLVVTADSLNQIRQRLVRQHVVVVVVG